MFIKKCGKYNGDISEKFNELKKDIFLREKKEIDKEQIKTNNFVEKSYGLINNDSNYIKSNDVIKYNNDTKITFKSNLINNRPKYTVPEKDDDKIVKETIKKYATYDDYEIKVKRVIRKDYTDYDDKQYTSSSSKPKLVKVIRDKRFSHLLNDSVK